MLSSKTGATPQWMLDNIEHCVLPVTSSIVQSIDLCFHPPGLASAFQVGPRFGSAASSLASCFHSLYSWI
jgi:hypothetical protein